jgi:membrane associated rhomboid family serine protease
MNTPAPNSSTPPSDTWPAWADGRQRYKWLHTLTWVLIYGGILSVIAGFATGDQSRVWGYSLGAVGACATVAGIVLIYIRSRLARVGKEAS